jgi:hypothetical protein
LLNGLSEDHRASTDVIFRSEFAAFAQLSGSAGRRVTLGSLAVATCVSGVAESWSALSMVALSFGTALIGRWDVLTQRLVCSVVHFLLLSGFAYDTLRLSSHAIQPLRE